MADDSPTRRPPQPATESWLARQRRRFRRRLLRHSDTAINGLHSLAAWLDQRRPVERRYFRVAIFGSSRAEREDATYRRVRHLGRELSLMGCDIVTGGGPGLMTAANEGARQGAYRYQTRSFGLDILLPMEEQPNPFLDEVSKHRTFFSRLHQFIRLSHAYLVVDGGLGTTLEGMMVWQLLQVGLLEERPLVFVGEMWEGLRDWFEHEVVAAGLASPRDLELVHWVRTDEEALAVIREARDRFLERHEVTLPPPAEEP
ncbi:MAG TPA: LOG family protein [Thermoanaerobaculia bacterium]|nr:LOG family protein [Thermoanaerobaculia bacterium]